MNAQSKSIWWNANGGIILFLMELGHFVWFSIDFPNIFSKNSLIFNENLKKTQIKWSNSIKITLKINELMIKFSNKLNLFCLGGESYKLSRAKIAWFET
jgi:hypothetical protein